MAKIHIDFYKKVKEFLEPFWKYIFIILGLMIIDLCLGLLAPYVFGKATDALLHNNEALTYKLIAGACLISIIQLQGLLFIRKK